MCFDLFLEIIGGIGMKKGIQWCMKKEYSYSRKRIMLDFHLAEIYKVRQKFQ